MAYCEKLRTFAAIKTFASFMKKIFLTVFGAFLAITTMAQGWPAQYKGVMLQGFYWDSFKDSKWTTLEAQADELAEYFSLVWIPQSGKASSSTSMGYDPLYYWNQNSTFGTEGELRSMIAAFKQKGLGTIADVVINHRATLTNWVDFPSESYKGETYKMLSTDICANDDGGATKTWANANGYQLSPNNDSGEGWDGMRDIDHASQNVQKIIKAYEDYLLNDLGYTGFRYDVGKGFAPKYFALYNNAAKPQFSVGEVWDSNQTIMNWINGTKTDGTTTYSEPQSAAFDFQFRYQVRDAINNRNWKSVAGSNCLIYNSSYKRYAVTFVENHDTEKRKDSPQDPILRDTLAANAFLLAMPGTPCVFFKHWQAFKKEIKMMIAARKLVGISNQSSYMTFGSSEQCTAINVDGDKSSLIVAVGPNAGSYTRDGWKTLMAGYKYKYLVPSSFDTSSWEATVKHIEETTSDNTPTYDIPDCATVQTGTYAYFEKPGSWKQTINVWAWYNDAAHSNLYPGASWPGTVSQGDISVAGTNAKTGCTVYLWKYGGTSAAPANIIFNDGSNQTADLVFKNGGYYTADGLVGTVTTGISPVVSDNSSAAADAWHTIGGMRVAKPTEKGIYIHNGKKYVVK